MGTVGSGGVDGGVVNALFLSVVAWETGDDRNIAEGDGKLVGDDAGDAAVAIEEGMDTDETVMKMGEETADFVDVGGFNVLDAVGEVASEAVEFVIDFGAAAGNVVEVFVTGCTEADIVTARA